MMTQFCLFASKKKMVQLKNTNNLKNFLKSHFDINQIFKIMLKHSQQIWNFTTTVSYSVLNKDERNDRKEKFNGENLTFEGDMVKLRPNICLLKRYQESIRIKLKKFSKIGQDKKSLISAFPCFLSATTKVYFL